jgi:GT2 family glycosyltransferase
MKIGIVVVSNSAEGMTAGFVSCVNAQRYANFELFLLERDGCRDQVAASNRLKLHVPYTLGRGPRNGNIATGINLGFEHFLADNSFTHILLLSDDAEISALFLESYVNAFRAHPHVDALSAKVLHPAHVGKISYAGGRLSYTKGGFKYFDRRKVERLLSGPLCRVTYAPTSSLMMNAWLLRDSGVRMWDELFVCDDNTIFCHELQKAGFRMYVSPKIEVRCGLASGDGAFFSESAKYYATRNWLYWGIKQRNLAVLGAAACRLIFHAVSGNRVELNAMLDSIRMARSAHTVLNKAPL